MTEKNLDNFIAKKAKTEAADRARELSLSATQSTSSDDEFRPVLDRASAESRDLIVENWRKNNNGTTPTDDQIRDEFTRVGSSNPVNIDERAAMFRHGRVTDPEGRTGEPVFVAGTAPDGRAVALNAGDVARLSSSVARIDTVNDPASDWGGATFSSSQSAPGTSYNSIAANTGYDKTGVGPADVLAHETGHVIHNFLGRRNNPFEGADPMALADFSKMVDMRAKAEGVRTPTSGGKMSIGDTSSFQYFVRPQEGFAEGLRMYLRDPNNFKTNYPNAAKFLRGVVNSDPNLSRLLMLSLGSINPVA